MEVNVIVRQTQLLTK